MFECHFVIFIIFKNILPFYTLFTHYCKYRDISLLSFCVRIYTLPFAFARKVYFAVFRVDLIRPVVIPYDRSDHMETLRVYKIASISGVKSRPVNVCRNARILDRAVSAESTRYFGVERKDANGVSCVCEKCVTLYGY